MKLKVTKRNRKYLHLGFALEFIILALFISSAKATTVNQFCAYVTGIPYASDNFTDEGFKYCRNTLNPNK